MIDYILKFADEATAKTALSSRLNRDGQDVLQWALRNCIPDIKVWRASQDVAGTVKDVNGNDVPTVTHTYLAGFYVLISLPDIMPQLRDLAVVQVVLDRDLAKTRTAGAVIKSNISNAILQDLRFEPVFAGSNFPYGDMK